ncbi:MAG TPA: Ca2+-dependent phosphoinositide-specific phospholipase C [Bryobacteraceae bacterium]|nr:Ca2+-dependent phosphoinositide-specific phospholipase C [Bryobacteraceae bacterium]
MRSIWALVLLSYSGISDAASGLSFQVWREVPGGGSTLVADAAVVYQGKLCLFGVGTSDHRHYLNIFDGATWAGWTAIPDTGTTRLPDATAVFQGKLYLFAIGTVDHGQYFNVLDGAAWSGWTAIPGAGTTEQPVTAVTFRDKLYVFAIGIGDHAHYMNAFNGAGWSGWSLVAGGGTTLLGDAAAVYRDKLYLFSVGTKDHAHYVNVFDGMTWVGWNRIPGGGQTDLSDAAATSGDRLYLFGIGIGDHSHYVNVLQGTTWSGWSPVQGKGTASVADAAVEFNSSIYLFAIGANDHRHYVNTAVELPRFDEVFRKATHNSYWVNASSATQDAFAAGPQQRVLDQALFEHVRAFEFDIHYKTGHPGEFDVYHTDNQDNSTCYSLEDCLQLMRRIDYVLPNHEPITVIIELKEIALPLFGNLAGQDHHPGDLDRLLWERLGPRIYTPREFLDRCPAGYSLRACARDYGWPTVDELRGRYIINVIGNYFRNDESYRNYTDDGGGVINRAAFPLRSVFDASPDDPKNCTGVCAARRANEVFWQVESLGKPDVPQFVADHGVVRSAATHMIADPVPPGNPDNIGKVSQQWVVSQGYQLLMTDYPWNFIEDAKATALNPLHVPSIADHAFFEAADVSGKIRNWDPSLLREPGGRITFDTSPRFLQNDRLSDASGTLEQDPAKKGYGEAFKDFPRGVPPMTWEIFPSTTSDSHSSGPRNNGHPGEGCFFARSIDARDELRVCRIAQMNDARDVAVRVTIKEGGSITYDNLTNVHRNVVTGLGDAFRIAIWLDFANDRSRVSVMTGNAVLPDDSMDWIQHTVNSTRGNGAEFFVHGILSRQGLSATNEVIFTGTTLNGQTIALNQLTKSGSYINDLSYCLDAGCRHASRPSHEVIRRQGGTVWVGVHETEGRVFGQWRTLYTTDRFEVSTSGLGQFPVYEKFLLAQMPGTNFTPLYRCVDWRRDYHQHWLSPDGACPNPNTKEPFAQNAGMLGYISTQQLAGMAPLWHLRKGTQNAGSADTHDHYFAVGDAQRDVKRDQEGYTVVGTVPIGYVYTPATLP